MEPASWQSLMVTDMQQYLNGYFSAEAKALGCTAAIWKNRAGQEVEVTIVVEPDRPERIKQYYWSDAVCIGEVVSFVRISQHDRFSEFNFPEVLPRPSSDEGPKEILERMIASKSRCSSLAGASTAFVEAMLDYWDRREAAGAGQEPPEPDVFVDGE